MRMDIVILWRYIVYMSAVIHSFPESGRRKNSSGSPSATPAEIIDLETAREARRIKNPSDAKHPLVQSILMGENPPEDVLRNVLQLETDPRLKQDFVELNSPEVEISDGKYQKIGKRIANSAYWICKTKTGIPRLYTIEKRVAN